MTTAMTEVERWSVAAGFALLAYVACWYVCNLALYFMARHTEKKNK